MLQYILGILIIVVGLGLSIGLHEIGHLVPAKLFGVKVTQYMIGFGPTIWSKRRGETEYGVKAFPLGGYISMIGMFPPGKGESAHESSTGFFQQLNTEQAARRTRHGVAVDERPQIAEGATDIGAPVDASTGTRRRFFNGLVQDARDASAETIGAGEETRAFYRLPVWKRIIVMLGGPAMNLLLAIVFFGVYLVGFGVPQSTTTILDVNECVLPATSEQTTCEADDPPSPAAAAGLRPGDTMISIGGTEITSWEQMSEIISTSPGQSLSVVYERDGEQNTTTLTPLLTERYVVDENGQQIEDSSGSPVTEEVGIAGIYSREELVRQPATAVLPFIGENVANVANIILNLPQRLIDVANAAFGPGERDPNGPMSVVGVGRIAGEVASLDDVSLGAKAQTMIGLLGSLNIALLVFNLVPLMPLDGGHVAAAGWEGIRRWFAKLRGRKDPGPVDAAKLMPLTFTVVIVLGAMSLLLIYADIVKPVDLFG
ncbi:site-2 protease family protein [Okibacterium endophyticum]